MQVRTRTDTRSRPVLPAPRLEMNSRLAIGAAIALCALQALAGDRLLATGGVTQVEGAGGGGLAPWALIAGTGTEGQVGVTASLTQLRTGGGFALRAAGLAVGIHNRVELSASTLRFGLSDTVPGQSIDIDTVGIKVRVAGDAVYDQDSPWPQIAVGALWKRNRDFDLIPRALGATSATGAEIYVAATKVWLAGIVGRNVLANATLRATNANQFGILGFGGPQGTRRKLMPEVSAALFINDHLAVGAEFRAKPDNLAAFKEQAASDLFVAWFPAKQFAVTAAYVNLGNIANKPRQTGWYLSAQVAF